MKNTVKDSFSRFMRPTKFPITSNDWETTLVSTYFSCSDFFSRSFSWGFRVALVEFTALLTSRSPRSCQSVQYFMSLKYGHTAEDGSAALWMSLGRDALPSVCNMRQSQKRFPSVLTESEERLKERLKTPLICGHWERRERGQCKWITPSALSSVPGLGNGGKVNWL